MSLLNWRQVWVVYGKEVRDTLRDRRTLLSMLLFPTLIIPGILIGATVIMLRVVDQAQAETATVMVIGSTNAAPKLRAAIEIDPKLKVIPATDDYARRISAKTVRAAIEIPADFAEALEKEQRSTLKIFNYEGELKSNFATAELERLASSYRESLVQTRLQDRQLSRALIRPFEIVRENVAPPEKVGGNRFGGVIPYLLIMACFMGAMYPAIDLATGEKERGTMEAILCTPVGRLELVLGKFLTVLSVALTTVAAALVGLVLSALAIAALILPQLGGASAKTVAASPLPTLNPYGLLGVLVIMIPLAILFSAIIFAVALIAKSHKEAQTYLSPLIGLMVIPGCAPMLPGVELNAKFALIPILNISLVSKEMVSGSFPGSMIAIIFGSSCVYSLAALAFAVFLFKRESVIFRT